MVLKDPPRSEYSYLLWCDRPKWDQEPTVLSNYSHADYFFIDHKIVETEDLETIAKKYGLRGWEELTKFNWGIPAGNVAAERDKREVNWYLFEHCGCRETTRDGKNYTFKGVNAHLKGSYPHPPRSYNYIWVPEKHPELVPIPVPVPKSQPATVDTGVCPRVNQDGMCSESQLECRYPYVPGINVDIGKKWKDYSISIREVTSSKIMLLTLNMCDIKPLPNIEPVGGEYDSGKEVVFSFFSQKGRHLRYGQGAAQSPPGKPLVYEDWTQEEKETLDDTQWLEEAAQHIRVLENTGVLTHVIVYGYIDWEEYLCTNDHIAMSKERAQWVIDRLKRRYGLLKPSSGVDVKVIGCGSFFAPRGKSDSRFRLARIEVKVKPPSQVETSTETGKVAAAQWIFREYTKGSQQMTSLNVMSQRANGRETEVEATPDKLEQFRKEAMDYVLMFEEFMSEVNHSLLASNADTLDTFKMWIQSWRLISSSLQLPRLIEVRSEGGEFVPSNYKRENEIFSIIEAGFSEDQANRIRIKVNDPEKYWVPNMRIYFNLFMPTA